MINKDPTIKNIVSVISRFFKTCFDFFLAILASFSCFNIKNFFCDSDKFFKIILITIDINV